MKCEPIDRRSQLNQLDNNTQPRQLTGYELGLSIHIRLVATTELALTLVSSFRHFIMLLFVASFSQLVFFTLSLRFVSQDLPGCISSSQIVNI